MQVEGIRGDEADVARAMADLARARDEFSLSLSALERGVVRNFDWREWVRRKPVTTLALAFGVGILLGRRR